MKKRTLNRHLQLKGRGTLQEASYCYRGAGRLHQRSKTGSFKANKKSHFYLYCLPPADGGCGAGMTSRSDAKFAARITKRL